MQFTILIFTYILFVGACVTFIRNAFKLRKLNKRLQLRNQEICSKPDVSPALMKMRIYTINADTTVTLIFVDILLLVIYFVFFR